MPRAEPNCVLRMSNFRAKHRAIVTTRAGTAFSIDWKNSLSQLEFTTNKGENMNTEEVAKKVVELMRKQAWHEALDTLR